MKARTEKMKGFTLVELLVAVAIFTTVAVVAVGSLVTVINSNNQSQSIKSAIDNINFAVDAIARNVRNGSKYVCYKDGQTLGSKDCVTGGNEISYIPSGSSTGVYYRFAASPAYGEGNIQECSDVGGQTDSFCTPNSPSWESMTAPTSTVNITNMTFYVVGSDDANNSNYTDRTQPRILITAQGLVVSKGKTVTNFTLQTTASRRVRNDNR